MEITISTPRGFVLAHATQADLDSGKVVSVEGNWYFDLSLANPVHLVKVGEGKNYHCPIKKGWCDYFDYDDGKEKISELAWIYPEVENELYKQVDGKIAFWKGKYQLVEKQ